MVCLWPAHKAYSRDEVYTFKRPEVGRRAAKAYREDRKVVVRTAIWRIWRNQFTGQVRANGVVVVGLVGLCVNSELYLYYYHWRGVGRNSRLLAPAGCCMTIHL